MIQPSEFNKQLHSLFKDVRNEIVALFRENNISKLELSENKSYDSITMYRYGSVYDVEIVGVQVEDNNGIILFDKDDGEYCCGDLNNLGEIVWLYDMIYHEMKNKGMLVA